MQKYTKHPNRINIILDLDNTLISSLAKDEETSILKPRMKQFRWENMENVYKVFERPGLQDFLDFLFDNFSVSVWTAASKSYALFIIEKFILHNRPTRKLACILYSHHCKKSKKLTKKQKALHILQSHFKMSNYDMNNTYIIDDHPEVYQSQPQNCIHIKPFEFSDRQSFKDDELLKVIKPKLEKLLELDKNSCGHKQCY